MNKKLIASAVATALVAPAAFSAIDDQGMQYVTAGEGLGGSLRVDVLLNTDIEADAGFAHGIGAVTVGSSNTVSQGNSIRLWVAGDSDLGGGLHSTYYVEFRDSDNGNADTAGHLYVDAFDIGLRGPFGNISFGYLGMVAPRMVPSADLAFERGSEREAFAADPGANGVRYESPVINGFQFGASGTINEAGGTESTLEEFSLAARYQLPVGLQLGIGFESKKNTEQLLASGGLNGTGAALAYGGDESSGFRFGARYSQDNWLVGYEYRAYEAFNGGGDFSVETESDVLTVSGFTATDNASTAVGLTNNEIAAIGINGFSGLDYDVHALGVQATVDRVVMSANYSTDAVVIDMSALGGMASGKADLERDTLALDAAYKLGSRSTMVVGWKKQDIDATGPDGRLFGGDLTETYLFYRVDF